MTLASQGSSGLKCKVMLNKVISLKLSQGQLDDLRKKKFENLRDIITERKFEKIEIRSIKDIELGLGIPYYEVQITKEKINPEIKVILPKKEKREQKNKTQLKTKTSLKKPIKESSAPITKQSNFSENIPEITLAPNPFKKSSFPIHDQNDIHPHFVPAPISKNHFSIAHSILNPQIKNFWNGLNPPIRNILFAGGSIIVAQSSFRLLPGLYENKDLNIHFKNEYLIYWALITGGRLLLNEILSKESSPRYWTIHSLKHIQWEKLSRHFGFSFLSLPLLQGVLYSVLSSTQGITNNTLKQSILFSSMALANGFWLYFTYGLLNESDKVRKHNFFRSMWGSSLGLSIALGLEAATQVPALAKTIPALIPVAQSLVQNSLILNKTSSDFIAYVIHSKDPVHQVKRKAYAKVYRKILKRYESEDKDLHRQATLDVIRVWVKEAYGKPGLEHYLLNDTDLKNLEEKHQLVRRMLSLIAPDEQTREKLKRSLYKIQTDISITLTPKLEKFLISHSQNFEYHDKTKKLSYFKEKSSPSPELISELTSCAKDKTEKEALERLLTVNLLNSVRKPYAIIENLEPYFNPFDTWLLKMDLKIQRKIKFKKLKHKYTHHLTEGFHRHVPEKIRLQIKNIFPKLASLSLALYSYPAIQKQADLLIANHIQLSMYMTTLNSILGVSAAKQIEFASLAATGAVYSASRMIYQSIKNQNTEFLKDFSHWIAGLTALFWVPNSLNILSTGLILILRPFEILKNIFNRYYKRV